MYFLSVLLVFMGLQLNELVEHQIPVNILLQVGTCVYNSKLVIDYSLLVIIIALLITHSQQELATLLSHCTPTTLRMV